MSTLAIGLIGGAIQLVGTFTTAAAQNKMVEEQTQASKKAENAREQQMQLDAQRRRRQSIREAIMARSMGLAAGVAQNAQYGSGVAGGMAGAVAMGAENVQGINSGEILGSRVFQSNRDYFDATQRGQFGMSMGQGISAFGSAIVNNAGAIQSLGAGFGTQGQGTGTYQNVPYPRPRPNRSVNFGMNTYNRGQGIQTYGRNWIM